MNINYKQPQFELFPANSATLEDVNKPRFLLANLTLSLESLVILSILGIMVALFSFSFGVEQGKHLAAQALDERVSAAWNVGARKAAVPVVSKPMAVAAPLAVTPAKSPVKHGNAGFVTPVAKPFVKAVPMGGNITVQLATYKSEIYAKQEAISLKAKGYPSFLIKKGDLWLVCAGRFTSLDGANIFLKKIQAKYRGSQIRRF